jgi:hypothetical protein
MRRAFVMLGAAVLLCGQLLAAIHFHDLAGAEGLRSRTQSHLDGQACAVCLLASHSPTNPASASPALERPQLAVERIEVRDSLILCSLDIARPHGRAPPASV